MSVQERNDLAHRQAEALAGILAGPVPPGMSPETLIHAADVLRAKRRREAAVAAPSLAEALGDEFANQFTRFAAENGYPRHGGPVADAAAFGSHLQSMGKLPAAARFEHVLLRARWGRRFQMCMIERRGILVIRLFRRVRVVRFF